MKFNEIIEGDCLKEMSKMPSATVDLILTDPPYGTNYGKVKGDENTELFKKSLSDIYRVLKDDRYFITYCSPKFLLEICNAAEELGFKFEWVGFNYYPNMFKQKRWPLGYNRHDMFIIFSKGTPPKKRRFMKDVVHILMDKNSPFHPHEKPMKAIGKLVKCGSFEGDVVLDPFCGVGTTCIAAKELSRKYIGIEIEDKYVKEARRRLKQNNANMMEDV